VERIEIHHFPRRRGMLHEYEEKYNRNASRPFSANIATALAP
jgi:hypothetical protein